MKLHTDWGVMVQPHAIPAFRTHVAIMNGVERRVLFKTWGGIGDQICAEPTLRYAIEKFKDCEIYLASECPELFRHLNFKKVFDLREETPNYSKYLVFDTISHIYESKIIEEKGYYAMPEVHNFVWQFFSHMLVNCVDFPALCALRLQLPVESKIIHMSPRPPALDIQSLVQRDSVFVHPGKHWQSKTFPKSFWDRVLAGLMARGITPIIIGANADDNRGTVDVNTDGCIDLRNKVTIEECTWLLQRASVLLTNDSSPMHMAASVDPDYTDHTGVCWVGYIATCKHPDMITHWRLDHGDMEPKWQYRERNFGKGGVWDVVDFCPNKDQKVEAEFIPPELLESWLPDPIEMASWAAWVIRK